MKNLETTLHFFAFVFFAWAAASLWHLAGPVKPGSRLYHVRVSGGSIVYQDYYTTNPPRPLPRELPWYVGLTNYEKTAK